MLTLEVISVPHHSVSSQPGVVAVGFLSLEMEGSGENSAAKARAGSR